MKPYPKVKRKVNREEIKYVVSKRDGICLWGFTYPGMHGACSAGLDPHHITPRSVGGDDDRTNLITLCRHHHDKAEAHVITPEQLREILASRFGYKF